LFAANSYLSNASKCFFFSLQLQQILLSYIPNPQLELFLVMLVVPFIVNVSDVIASTKWGGLETDPFQWEECTAHGLGQP